MNEKRCEQTKVADNRPAGDSSPSDDCCRLFYGYLIPGRTPLIVLECCRCGRLWHQRQDGTLVPYDESFKPLGVWPGARQREGKRHQHLKGKRL